MNLIVKTKSFTAGSTGTFKGAERVLIENTHGSNAITVAGKSLANGETLEWSVHPGDKIEFDYATGTGTMEITYAERVHNIGEVNLG